METKNKPAFDEVAQGVARIIFGDENITEMNVRLTRIALERYSVPEMQAFDEIAQGVARIIFGDAEHHGNERAADAHCPGALQPL